MLFVLVRQSSISLPASIEHRTIAVDGIERSYRIVIPDEKPTGTRRPLLVALHGATQHNCERFKASDTDGP